MRRISLVAGALIVLMSASCGGGGGISPLPTEQEMNAAWQATLRSVAGDWEGVSHPPNTLSLAFRLVEGANGQVSGSGTMRENSAAPAVPFTVTGTFQQPLLTLAFDGMVVDSRPVQGTLQGSYTTIGGIAAPLKLSAPGYSREIAVLLQEK